VDLKFAEHTESILSALPHWFKMRKGSADSIGARFLNVAGLKIDDVRYVLDYAYAQTKISTADINQIDFCYKAIVPMPLKISDITRVFAHGAALKKAFTLKEFFGIDQNIQNQQLHSFDLYYADEKRNILYVRQKFNVDAIYSNGYIEFDIKDNTYQQALVPHQVWNFFDEFGLLLSCPRLPEEPNVNYKKRIMDVFKNPANASTQGLVNGIGRELNLRRSLNWANPKTDLELEDPMIVLNSIKANGKFVSLSNIWLSESGTILIKGDSNTELTNVEISYVYGLELHKLWNKNDTKLYNELFTIENKPKSKLTHYMEILNSEAPVFWNDFHWNEHYWDLNDQNVSGYGMIPTRYDGSIAGFRSYKRK
jgi:hypothetical protein